MSAGDICFKCGESRGAIRRERLICWDGYDELGKHRFVGPEPVVDRTSSDVPRSES